MISWLLPSPAVSICAPLLLTSQCDGRHAEVDPKHKPLLVQRHHLARAVQNASHSGGCIVAQVACSTAAGAGGSGMPASGAFPVWCQYGHSPSPPAPSHEHCQPLQPRQPLHLPTAAMPTVVLHREGRRHDARHVAALQLALAVAKQAEEGGVDVLDQTLRRGAAANRCIQREQLGAALWMCNIRDGGPTHEWGTQAPQG